jgi:acyl-CoA thioesterase-1
MLTGPAAEGTVKCSPRALTMDGGAVDSGAIAGGRDFAIEAGDDGMASMPAGYGLHTSCRKSLAVLVGLFVGWMAGIVGAQAKPIRLLALGDSLMAGYGLAYAEGFQPQLAAALRAKGYDVVIIDAAVSGDTTAGGRARLDWALQGGADAALVELGANDGLRGIDPASMEGSLGAILDTLAARHIPVLLTGMYAPPNLGRDYADAFRAAFARLGARPGVIFDPFFLQDVAGNPALNQPDGIHPNADGVRRIVARLLPSIEHLLNRAGASAG